MKRSSEKSDWTHEGNTALTDSPRSNLGSCVGPRRILTHPLAGMHFTEGHRPLFSASPPACPEPEIEADLILEGDIVPHSSFLPPDGAPHVFLLTGTTGFLGAYLLHDLLANTRAQVVCLVRATSPAHGRTRIEENLRAYGLPLTTEQWDRVEIVPGDISQTRLGLTPAVYDALAARVEAIIHGAAVVNFYQTYSQLRPTNVGGIREMLRFAVSDRLKAFHYVSSTGVFDSDACRGMIVRETDSPTHCAGSVMGYTEAKWVAEQLVLTARARGVPASIYRPPFIMGDSRTGAVDAENLVVKTMIGSLQGQAWFDESTRIEMIPVDALSRAIVHLAVAADLLGQTYHLASPEPMRWRDLGIVLRSRGYALDFVSYDEWKRRLAVFGRTKGNALRPLLRFFTRPMPGMAAPSPEMFIRPPRPVFDSTATQAVLAPDGLVPPRLTPELLATYLDFFVRQGWLDKPKVAMPSATGSVHRGSRPPQAACETHA